MDDMGILRTTIAVESHTRRGALVELADTMVDTGSPRGSEDDAGDRSLFRRHLTARVSR